METDSSDEREIYENRLSSSSSSNDQTDEESQSVSQAKRANQDKSRVGIFDRDLFPFQDVSDSEMETECPGVDHTDDDDDNGLVGMKSLFVDREKTPDVNKTANVPITSTHVVDKDFNLFDDEDSDEDDDLGFDLFGDNRITSSTKKSVSGESRDIDQFSSKTKVDGEVVCPTIYNRRSILDDILKKSGTDSVMGDKSKTRLNVKDGETAEEEEFCCICRDEHTDPVVLPKCSHKYCRECIDEYFKIKPMCPECFVPYGVITGNQPEGHMDHSVNKKLTLGGNSKPGAIVIYYSFDSGTQTAEHPKPGVQYYGTSRTAYLPDTPEGHKVLRLLCEAFKRRLVFTVGRSRTTGADNQVTWNDIHHKTSPCGGHENFGYPDATYLRRVQEELAAVGVTEDSL